MKIKYELTIMYKNNSQFSSEFSGCNPFHLLCNLIGTENFILNTIVEKSKKGDF